MELELKKLEDLSEAIVNDFAYMRAREEQMRDTNGKFHFVFRQYHSSLPRGLHEVGILTGFIKH